MGLFQYLLRPIGRLTDAAARLAGGKPTSVPFTTRTDELGSLARALEAWQQTAADTARVFQHSPIGIARLTQEGDIEEANAAFERMLQDGRGPLEGRNYLDVIDPTDRPHLAQKTQELANEAFTTEVRLLKRDGTGFWGNLTMAAVPAPDHRPGYLLLMLEDIDLRKRQELELAHRAAHDPLTNLPNRRLFEDRLDQALKSAHRRRRPLALLLLDLDRFKPVNDEIGHHAGDLLLTQLAKRLTAVVRESDTVARLGGDEFAVLLAEDDEGGALTAADKLLAAASATPFDIEGHALHIGLSVGVAVYPTDGADAKTLVRAADQAMYRAKQDGTGYQLAARPVPSAPSRRVRVLREAES
ncbi:MAG TPA: diguanylate cyclase [Candidatus Dormibacteraeota bacterium]